MSVVISQGLLVCLSVTVLYIGCLAVFCIRGCFSVCLYVPGAACLSVFACLYVCLLSVLYIGCLSAVISQGLSVCLSVTRPLHWLSFCRYMPGTVCLSVCSCLILFVFQLSYVRSTCLSFLYIGCLFAVMSQGQLICLSVTRTVYWLSFYSYKPGTVCLFVCYPSFILVVCLQL